ncbi:MAG: hypothetical protein A2W99_09385 [Bacteroidetes bacterium GWF2_33_16]|nr:MAG: hypothetical protein A2X00_06295 [Bacteroidetes bacterium GWE2_32_14]OFY07210.1 MAG: hypothetical protein A2W99_09385 [Bacteroidetes bacterium GWF2_33_16]
MILIPYFFKDEILTKVKDEINKNVHAKVEFADVSLSLFKSFPDFNLGLHELSVIGIEKFDGDTLMYFKSFNVEVDLMSAIKKNVVVKGIILDQALIQAKVLADSSANWDITIPSEELEDTTAEQEIETAGETSDFRLQLKKFQIKNAHISYDDATSDMVASLDNLNFLLKGNFGLDYSDLSINTAIDAINVKMGGIRYLKNARFGFDATIGADMVKSIYTFKDNLLSLNDIALAFEGSVEMPDDDITVDMRFNTKKTSFKSLLSMVPVIYMEGFEQLKTSGNLILEGDVKGTLTETQTPSANLRLVVENAMFQYPDLPKSVENVNIDLSVFYDGVNNDNTKVDLNKFHLEVADNPFDIAMHIRTPMSDPFIEGNINGHLILSSFKDVLPLEDVNLDGEITADVNIAGNYSTIEKEKYEDFKASGKLQLKNFIFESKDLPATVKIIETTFNFTPKYLELQSFLAQIGKSDFNLNGKIENYIAFALKDETIKGVFNFSSKFIDANEFLTDSEEEIVVNDTTEVPMTVFEVPGNVDFRLQSSLDHILYDKMDITNLKGLFIVKDKKVVMENLNMNMLDGKIGVNGEYNTQDIEIPSTKMSLDIRDIEISTAVNSFSMIGKIASILKNCKGKISIKFDYTSLLDSTMSPVLNSIEGYGRLQSNEIQVVDSKTFNKLTDMVKLGDNFNNTFKDVNISFNIHDGRIIVDPFVTSAADIKLKLGGSHGVDQTMDYDLTLTVPTKYFGSAANDLIDGLLGKAADKGVSVEKPQNISIDAKITGMTTDPKISLGKGKSADKGTKSTKEQLIETGKEVIKEKAGEELAAQAQKIIDDAEKEAAKLKEEAQVEADKVLKEANDKADALVKKAAKEGPLAKVAAEKTASSLKKEAKKQADKLVKEAGVKADKLVEDAKIKAEKLQSGDNK